MTPYIALKIENFVPQLHIHTAEDKSRKITQLDENILDSMKTLAKELNINLESKNDEDIYEELLRIARESDEFYLPEYADLNPEETEFELKDLFSEMLKQAKTMEQEYKDVEMTPEARAAIDENQSNDIFSSITESMYLRLIAKTLIAASELGVGEIHLNDQHKNPRLAEQMKKELDRMGVELVIE